MLEAYLDESGIQQDAAVCVIAGFYGGRGQWKKFESDWKAALSRYDVPLEEFHAKDILKKKCFKGWTSEKYERFFGEISEAIVSNHKIRPINYSLQISDFYARSLNERRFLTGAKVGRNGKFISSGSPHKPYFMPFHNCVKQIANYAPKGGKAHFFLGLGRPFAEYAAQMFRQIKADPTSPFVERIGALSFPLAKETPELQAADWLAHLTYVELDCRPAYNWDYPLSPRIQYLCQNARSFQEDLYCIEKEYIERALGNAVSLPTG